MKKVIYKYLSVLVLFGLIGCSSDDKTIDKVFDGVETGAFLRITSSTAILDLNDPDSPFAVTLEFDGQDISMMDRVEYGLTFVGANASGSADVGTLLPGDFEPSSFGVPASDISITYGEALSALGIAAGDVEPTDALTLVWTVYLTDGRSYGPADANGNVSAIGGFYSSPYKLVAVFKCGLTSTDPLFNGNFEVLFDEWADYAEGDLIPVIPDPDDPLSFRILSTNNPYINNTATSYIKVTVLDENGTVSAASNEDFDYGGGFVVPVTGSGTINTCTGEILIDLDFSSAYTGYTLQLAPAN